MNEKQKFTPPDIVQFRTTDGRPATSALTLEGRGQIIVLGRPKSGPQNLPLANRK